MAQYQTMDLPDDMITYYLSPQTPSNATFTFMRDLRAVSHMHREQVDAQMENTVWKSPWLTLANEFCDGLAHGTVLLPGMPHNAGLENMILNKLWPQLVADMNEFLMDENTQVMILEQLVRLLQPPRKDSFVHIVFNNLQEARAAPGLFRSVVQAMRMHSENTSIQSNGSILVHVLVPAQCNDDLFVTKISIKLTQYTIVTLIYGIYKHPTDIVPGITFIRSMYYLIQILKAHKVPPAQIVTAGPYNVLSAVVYAARFNQTDSSSDHSFIHLLNDLLHVADSPAAVEAMMSFDVDAAEDQIISTISHISKCVKTQTFCTVVLNKLYQRYPLRMRRPTEAMACAKKILEKHGRVPFPDNELACSSAIKLLCTLVRQFWVGSVRPPGAAVLLPLQVRPTVEGVIPHMVIPLLRMNVCVESKILCTQVFNCLLQLCRQHPEEAAVVCRLRVFNKLTGKYRQQQETSVDADWQNSRAAFAILLASL